MLGWVLRGVLLPLHDVLEWVLRGVTRSNLLPLQGWGISEYIDLPDVNYYISAGIKRANTRRPFLEEEEEVEECGWDSIGISKSSFTFCNCFFAFPKFLRGKF